MTLAAYHGHEALTFTDYLDLGTGKTLHAEPREEPYDVAPASGRAVPEIPAGWFTPIQGGGEDAGAPAEGDGAPDQQQAGEPAHDQDPETDDPQQF